MEEPWMDLDEAAKIIGRHRTNVRRYVVRGLLQAVKRGVKRGRKAWYTKSSWIKEFQEQSEARKRIAEKAARFGAGMTERPCATSASTTEKTEPSS